MAPQTRLRSRSSVEHIFELVENLDDDQLQNLLLDLNSTNEGNVQVSKGVEYFEEQRRTTLRPSSRNNVLRPTPSFLNQPHEPSDWPRQKPRPVSGSQWRGSMRIVSTPYTNGNNMSRHNTEPISPPLTASPPLSPPLSPPKGLSSPVVRRSVTAPVSKGESMSKVDVETVVLPLQRDLTPPRDVDIAQAQPEQPRPSLSEFGAFNFGLNNGAVEDQKKTEKKDNEEEEEEEERPVSPQTKSVKAQATQQTTPPAPLADFSRMNTMPLPSFHASEAMDIFHDQPIRPRTATGDAATTNAGLKPRAFRRISRPMFLSPIHAATPDDLAKKLSAYLFEDAPLSPPPPAAAAASTMRSNKAVRPSPLDDMLMEPATPRSVFVFGRAERQLPTSGILQVLTEG